MAENIPRKEILRADNAPDAVTLTIDAMAAAAVRGAGINLETTFPGGRIIVRTGEITVSKTASNTDLLT